MTSPSLTPGERLGAYEVSSLLGAGGMGEVYRATDTRLGREVAIKVLPSGMAQDPERLRRFELEARSASSLNHPNIVVVHDVGTHRGSPYLVSELLEGETLRTCLGRGRLPAKGALEIGAQVASGLAAAHEKGIVHRDLKPENLFLTRDGHVKILDFGLAKHWPAAGHRGETRTAETLARGEAAATSETDAGTEPGKVMGTVAYMSPEQVRGEAVDQRSDIFSLGCVLYELASGGRAFKRDTAAETMTAILREEPSDLAALSAELPPGFGRAIAHCLEKRPEGRFQTARDLGFALRVVLEDSGQQQSSPAPPKRPPARRRWAWVTGIGLGIGLVCAGAWWGLRDRAARPGVKLEPKRVAVAVFENQTGDASLDSFGRIAADWINHGLAQIGEIEVVPTSATVDAGQAIASPSHPRTDPLRALAEATGAGMLVSGSYYAEGPTLRVQAKVMNAADWTLISAIEPISGERASPMKVIDALRQRVMGVVAMQHKFAFSAQMQRPPIYEAYQEFAIGESFVGKDMAQTIQHYKKAIEIDPGFFQPKLFIAVILMQQGDYAQADAIARGLNDRRQGTTSGEQHQLDWLIANLEGRRTAALEAVRKLHTLTPRSAQNAFFLGAAALAVNQPRLAVDTMTAPPFQGRTPDSFPDLDVLKPQWLSVLAEAHHMLGSYDHELEASDQNIRIFPASLQGRLSKVRALAALGKPKEAERLIDDSLPLQFAEGTAELLMRTASLELRAHGDRAAALRMAERAVEWRRAQPSAEQSKHMFQHVLALTLYFAERWDESREISERLLARYPLVPKRDDLRGGDTPETVRVTRAIGYLGRLGALAARRGDRQEAKRVAQVLAGIERPFLFGEHTLRRARIAALLGDRERAVGLLRDAFAQGYARGVDIHRDPDLEPLRGYAPFEELIKPRG
jgi:serine/threonine protein kinase/tetratricopeptide (TPR) repeat protein/TolB-like protein